jgi:hypothetical protein
MHAHNMKVTVTVLQSLLQETRSWLATMLFKEQRLPMVVDCCTHRTSINFSCSAIAVAADPQEQQEMKLALLLNVVDPNIGGVLIMGDRGTAKSVAVSDLPAAGLGRHVVVRSLRGICCCSPTTQTGFVQWQPRR